MSHDVLSNFLKRGRITPTQVWAVECRYFCEIFLSVLLKNQQKLRNRYAFGFPIRPDYSFATQQDVTQAFRKINGYSEFRKL
jgi:hypothetical protein